jgi:glycosyltransferase involved in cell wall biosynthesis
VTEVAFLVNGGYESPMGYRARSFATHLASFYDIHIDYRSGNKFAAILSFAKFLFSTRPIVTYVFDMSFSGVLAAILHKSLTRTHVIIDTGDSISALARSMGRGRVGVWLTDCLEKMSFMFANYIVVRGSFHRDLLRNNNIRVELIRDGVDAAQFAPCDATELRRQNGLDGVLTIGMVGSSIWNEKLQMCYGWDLIEAVRLLKDKPVKAVIIGDGSGILRLKALCRKYAIEDKVLFLGFVLYEHLPLYLSMIDVCLSTQTNDVVGQVRTTGKLPLYLASGRHILASNVGEAALVLHDEMLVPYEGVKDESYPVKLAERINQLLERKGPFHPSESNIALAREEFDYSVLSKRVGALIEKTAR